MIKKIFPFLDWVGEINLTTLRADLVSGLTVALILIPQSMAYAQLAGMPAYYGLYASLLPPMLAALFGSSRQLATGPVAIVSLMTNAALAPLATAGSEAYIAYAILLALIVGLFQFALGVLRLGLVVNFLSHPVVNGFTNAGAIIIATSQLSKMFGVSVDSAAHHYETVYRVIKAATHYTHWPTLGLGLLAFGIMYGLRRLNPKIPYVLVAVAVATIISWATGFEKNQKVPLQDVMFQPARAYIEQFNSAVNEFEELGRQRAELSPQVTRAEESYGHNSREALDLKHKALLMSMRMDELKGQIQEYRAALREYLFTGVKGGDGRLLLYPEDEVPRGYESDGNIWRIKVRNSPIDASAVTVVGGGDVVGVVPQGLPSLAVPKLDLKIMLHLLPVAAIISLLGFMEAISIAKAMAAKTGQRLDPNQELIGQGIANILGAVGKSYPVSGSFSRSAVNIQSGAVTGLSSLFTSVTVGIVLLFFTPLLYYLPQSVLAAVIMMAVLGLINVSGFIHAYKAQWYDGLFSIITFIATLITAPHLDRGIMIGVVLSLVMFLYKSMRPKVTTLSMYADHSYRSARDFGLKECRHIALIRFDGSLFYANAGYLEEKITEITLSMPELKHIIIVSNGINDMDASGEEMLSLIVDRVRSAGYDISFSGIKENVLEVMKRTHLDAKIGYENMFPTMHEAVSTIHSRAHTQCDERSCPLLSVCFLEQSQ
ncbi:SulP family inorganic anion transporter [Desulfoferrobacter suflitae]|uniref:SulP family inorganic anion transporter n=1 Tax=Desulfoferrobacter suflitae TaxID=2865782 RepID=UPI00216490B6|nr:SulP family inorganic anion transporter [Desulfoferrobacter suflitae]MCK8600746.1 SulP family inorganic anion transporter [Desulfoferrobacter suflitae]